MELKEYTEGIFFKHLYLKGKNMSCLVFFTLNEKKH